MHLCVRETHDPIFWWQQKTAWCLHPKTKMLKVRPCWIMPGSADSCCATVWSRSTRPQGAQWWENPREFSEDDLITVQKDVKPQIEGIWSQQCSGWNSSQTADSIFRFKEVIAVRVQFHMQMHVACTSTTNRNEMLFQILSVCEMGDSKSQEWYN